MIKLWLIVLLVLICITVYLLLALAVGKWIGRRLARNAPPEIGGER